MSPPRAVFLDFGGTLADRRPSEWSILIRTCGEHGRKLTRKEIDHGRALADRNHRSIQYLTAEGMDFFWPEWFRLILANLGVDESRAIAEETYARMGKETSVVLYDDVMDALRALGERDLCLGVVSNFNCLLEARCRKLGIAEYFDFILASDLIGSGKPQPVIFNLAVGQAGFEARECVHVGDSYGADYMGARDAGLQALLLDRTGQEVGRDCPRIADLGGISEYL